MEDFLLKEIDRLADMLLAIAKRLGLYEATGPKYTYDDVAQEFLKNNVDINLDEVLDQDNPVLFLIEKKRLSDNALEVFTQILVQSEMDEDKKQLFLKEAVNYLDSKGKISFVLHSYML